MAAKALCAALVGLAAALAIPAPVSTRPLAAAQVVFLSKPTRAVQGSAVHATVVVSRVVPRCSGTLQRGQARRTKVVAVARLRASFTWQLAASAAPGVWRIAVSCGSAGSTSASFTVTRRAPPAAVKVAVDQSGLSAAGSDLSYGAVLRNTSPDRDAVGVTVTVNVLDAGGRILKSDAVDLVGIPASATYYLGGAVQLDAGSVPATLRVDVRAAGSGPRKLELPPVANVQAVDSSGQTHVEGELTNPSTRPMSSLTRITSVVFDASGNVIGGGVTFPAAPVQPNARVAFDMPIAAVTIDRVASVRASVGAVSP